jgi:hypothetical protein
MRRRLISPIGPRQRHRYLPTHTAGTHKHRLTGPALNEQNLQLLPTQRMKRMPDNNKTQIITG